jgi:thioesterase domain-containing protein
MQHLKSAGALRPGIEGGRDHVERMWQVFRANMHALRSYVPEPYPGTVVLVPSSETLRRFASQAGPNLGWETLAAGGVEVHPLVGDHYSILRRPAVRLLAQRFESYLDGLAVVGETALPQPASRPSGGL